ncbi:MAG: polysaccharide deacetylase family protein [Clostridiales bacterium]|nr:polysaccharide deacetylase family protein [Clostridiales bacterium]
METRSKSWSAGKKRKRKKKLKWHLILPGLLILLAVIFGVGKFVLAGPTLQLSGEKEMTVEVLEPYEEPGVKASWHGKDLSSYILVDGTVNTEIPGDYNLTYRVEYNGKSAKKTRIIHVVDTEAPVLTLKQEGEEVFASSMDTYKDPGYKAKDNFDGNLTKQVEILKESIDEDHFKVTLRVWDQAGNLTTAERTVTIKDMFPPEITLLGEESMVVQEGAGFQDPGVEAVDDLDGDISSQVTIDGYVDPYMAGEYTLTYYAKDSSGNQASVQRTVTVEKSQETGEDSVIYLTFDDGPSSKVTPEILDILKKNNVQATFFIIDYQDTSIPVLKRMVEEGNTIGIHTWSHDYEECYGTDQAYLDGVEKMQQKLKDDLDYDAFCIRFPGGSSNTISADYNEGVMTRLARMVVEEGFQYYDWNVDSTDAEGNNVDPNKLISSVTNSLKKGRGNIVLCHDTNAKQTTAQALQAIIDYGKANGYRFSAIQRDTKPVHHGINN